MNLFNDIRDGNKVSLAKGITLLESTLDSDKKNADKLLSKCMPFSGNSIRIGITGIPGVGKSTFIETFGKLLSSKGYKIAVLAIDPSSSKSHGSILGDKSRMTKLDSDNNAFIRPSPTSGTLGGISNTTRESIILCEAAGFNIILVETVGVGQSEVSVDNIVDFFLLLAIAGAGDELQGIKRGIMELADLIAITKSDGENIINTNNTKQDYIRAIQLFPNMQNGWDRKVVTCSAIEENGIDEIWDIIDIHNKKMRENGWVETKRDQQNIYWLHHKIKEDLGNKKYIQLQKNNKIQDLEKQIKDKSISSILDKIQ